MSALVLGIGNLLMGDEGVGVHVVRRLLDQTLPDGVTVVDGGTGGFHLLSCFQDYDRLVLIDAAADGQAPGTVSTLEPVYASDYPRSLTAHDIGLKDVVEAAALLGPLPKTFLVTVSVAAPRGLTLTLSPAVEAALPGVAAAVARCLGLTTNVSRPEGDLDAHLERSLLELDATRH
jgi:hydrogenase maturation protease